MNDAEKALTACGAIVAAKDEVKRLTKSIGDHLSACLLVNSPLIGQDGVAWETHLAKAYWYWVDEETQYTEGRRVYFDDDEQIEILADCPHCMAAHIAIQDRKKAKLRLANARRSVTLIGRRVLSGDNHG